MSTYLWIKLLHILGSTVLFGTGMGIAYFMLKAYLSGNREAWLVTTRLVVRADYLFTTPAVIVQMVTGIWLTLKLGIPYRSVWFVAVISLFALVGACWIPVVNIQIQLRDRLASGGSFADCRQLMRAWVALGVVAFSAVLAIFYLMVSKTGAGQLLFA